MSDVHDKHRSRMFERLKKEGTGSFFDHELLEMLLYFVIPRGDTNPIAHSLMTEFKGINGVMKADVTALKSIHGIGNRSADLLSIVSELVRRCIIKGQISENYYIKNIKDAVTYCKTLFIDKKYECLYAICLDIKGRVIADGYIGEGVIDQVPAYSRKVVETALRHTAYSVIIAHNHPGGDCKPSDNDDVVTQKFRIALDSVGIHLNDHIIIGTDDYYSYASAGLLENKTIDNILEAAQKNNLL